jgi:hypothetical protein
MSSFPVPILLPFPSRSLISAIFISHLFQLRTLIKNTVPAVQLVRFDKKPECCSQYEKLRINKHKRLKFSSTSAHTLQFAGSDTDLVSDG